MLNKLLACTLFTLLAQSSVVAAQSTENLPILSGIGGDFSAINTAGETVKFSDFAGKVVVLTFGYTNCADVCPVNLGYLKRGYSALSTEDQQKVQVIFVTIDPEYDELPHLEKFVADFNRDFVGLSGTQAQIDSIMSLYQAEYNKLSETGVATENMRRTNPKIFADQEEAKQDKASLFSHTASLYLIDKQGRTRGLAYTGTAIEEFSGKIRQLIYE